ncbi:MAG: glycoside hydrolase family 16 protein [Phycisphaerae bacterium]|nr:glycoside hydrolase family 16 protein [Phycisphaerae bacterium]
MTYHHTLYVGAMLAGLALCTPLAGGQTLIWSDEFDGPSIDRSTWTYNVGTHGFGNGELQYHTARPENAYIDSGNLVIEARRESYLNNLQFTSSRLVTHGRLAFTYGTLEARIKLPDVDNGLWPAFWLLGNNIGQMPWPACGELDIMEVGSHDAYLAGVVNRRVGAHAFWDYQGSQADYGGSVNYLTDLYSDYHLFALEWTPTSISTSLDGVTFWAMDISDVETNSLEEFHQPMYIIANLAVGGWNFVEITDPAQITAPFPGRMYVDYIRLYDNGDTQLYLAEDTAETDNFGVFTETTPVSNHVAYEVDASLYLWNNLVAGTTTPYEGAEAWNMAASAGSWFGMGVFSHIDRNMQNYSDGHLHFHMKTLSAAPFKIGVASSAAGEGWLQFASGEESHGLMRDGNWHEVVIPLNSFLNVDFNTINQLFMIAGDAPASTFEFSIDNVYWSPSVPRQTPEHGSFGILTEDATHKTAGEYTLGVDGELYVWENTLVAANEHPYEGSGCLSFTSAAGLNWFGAAFTPNTKYNLTAFRYAESTLHLALKTSSSTTFYLGMRSGNVNDIGQKWIRFASGSDPYGFVRDGAWHVVEIPMTDITDAVDLAEVSMLFELLGVDGPISNIEIDDVCLLGGGAAIVEDEVPGDADGDGDVDADDFAGFADCMAGPFNSPVPAELTEELCLGVFDFNDDYDVDLGDFAEFQQVFDGTAP